MGNGQARPAAGPRDWASTAQLGLCAVFGGLLAALADLVQKEHASPVLKLSSVVNTYLGLPLPRWGALLFIVIVAGLVSLIYQADNMQKSFVRGLSVLSVVMTAVPYSTPPTQVSFVGAENRSAIHELVVGVALAQSGTPAAGRTDQIPVTLRLVSDRPAPEASEVTVTVVAPSTGRTIARMVYPNQKPVAGESRLIQDVSFSLPQGRYILRIEVSGHRIATQEIEVRDAKVARDVQMQSTKVPLFLQRLGE